MKNKQVYSIWKPNGITSFDVIRKIKKCYKSIDKVGHCGTLDPFAEGILIVCTGTKVKEVDRFMNLPKTYIANFIFGSETNTLDSTGEIIKKSTKQIKLSAMHVEETLLKFTGTYNQIPPYFCAKKINGLRMYEFARKNIFIKPKGTKVSISKIDLINLTDNSLRLKIACGKGTYIRSLARDIAYELNTYAYVDALIRTEIGNYNQNNSIKFDNIGEI